MDLHFLIPEIMSRLSPLPKQLNYLFPFYSQWESPSLVPKFLNKSLSVSKDPRWKKSGASNPQEYEYWSWNICGMACLKSILVSRFHKHIPLVSLAKKAAVYGCYFPRPDRIDGLFYQPFVKFIKQEYRINSQIASPLSILRIKYELSKGNVVMVSVHGSIRNIANPSPKTKGGHLVLVTGFNHNSLYFHNPSGMPLRSQKNVKILNKDFSRFFSNKGIIINI